MAGSSFIVGFLLFPAIFTVDWWITLPFGAVVLYRGKDNVNEGNHLKGSTLLTMAGILVIYGVAQLL